MTNHAQDTRVAGRPLPAVLAAALIVAPMLHLVGGALSPQLKGDAGDQLAVIAAHPTRWYWYSVLLVVGSIVAIPACVGLLQLGAARMRRVGAIGGALVTLGFVGSVMDCAYQLWEWQMVSSGADRAQMTALLNRVDNAAGIQVLFQVCGIGLLIGTVLLTIALVRSSAVPSWAAIAFAAAVFVNIFAFSANNATGVLVSFVLLALGMGSIGIASMRPQTRPQSSSPSRVPAAA